MLDFTEKISVTNRVGILKMAELADFLGREKCQKNAHFERETVKVHRSATQIEEIAMHQNAI